MSFALITALFCAFSWISVSICEFHTMEVQPGEDVTLLCSNFSSFPTHISWFKLDNRPNISCISSMNSSDGNASLFAGFHEDKFQMTSNTRTLFLKIRHVDFSDSGLYFCGFCTNEKSEIVSATYLRVQEAFHQIRSQASVILSALVIVLIIIVIFLVVEIRELCTASNKGPNPQHSEDVDSDALNYAALSFNPRPNSSCQPPSENQLEPNVVYAATR